MAQNRSIITALGILLGPTLAYLSYLSFKSGFDEFIQLIIFALFFIVAYELGKSRISLSGILAVLLLPAGPIAIVLSSSKVAVINHLSPKTIIILWAASVLLGALLAGLKVRQGDCASIIRLTIIASILLLLAVASIWFVPTGGD